MRKIILFILLLVSAAKSEDSISSSMEMHARLYPQLLTFSKHLEQVNSISISVIYSPGFDGEAEYFKELVIKKFSGNLKQKKLDVILIPEEFVKNSKTEFDAAYILSDNPRIKILITNLNKKGIITFAGTENALESGALIGIRTGEKVQILLNKQSYQNGNFSFSQSLIKMVKIYEKD